MAAPDAREVNRRRMAWQLAAVLAFTAGLAHVLSARFIFLLFGVVLLVAGALMVDGARRRIPGHARTVAWVAAVPLFLWHGVSLLGWMGRAEGDLDTRIAMLSSSLWIVALAVMLAFLHWGAPDGRGPEPARRDPGLV